MLLLLLPLVLEQVAVLGSAGRKLRGEAGVAAHNALRWARGLLPLVLS